MSNLTQARREEVGRKIRSARLTSGLSHDKLAAAVGSSRQHLIKLEKGQHLPGEGMLAKIAEATGKSVDYFADDDEEADLSVALASVIQKLVRSEVQRVAA